MAFAELWARLRGDSSHFEGAVNRGVKKIGDFRHAAGEVAPLLGSVFSVAGIIHFTKHAIEAGAHVQDLANRLGVSATLIQKFDYAAKQTGTDMEVVVRALLKANANIANGGLESGKYAKALDLLNLKQADLIHLSPDEFLLRVADAFAHTEDRAQANAAAIGLFGNKVQAILPLLAQGREGIEALFEEAPTKTDQAIAEFKRIDDQLTHSSAQWKVLLGGLAKGISEAFLQASAVTKAGLHLITGDVDAAKQTINQVKQLLGKFELSPPDVSTLQDALAKAQAAVADLKKTAAQPVAVELDAGDARVAVAAVQSALEMLRRRAGEQAQAGLDTSATEQSIAALETKLTGLQDQAAALGPVDLNTAGAQADLAALYETLGITTRQIQTMAHEAQANGGLTSAADKEHLTGLKDELQGITAQIAALRAQGVTVPVNLKIASLTGPLNTAAGAIKEILERANAPTHPKGQFGAGDDAGEKKENLDAAKRLREVEAQIADERAKADQQGETASAARERLLAVINNEEIRIADAKRLAETDGSDPAQAAAKERVNTEKAIGQLKKVESDEAKRQGDEEKKTRSLHDQAAKIRDQMFLESLSKAEKLAELQRRQNALVKEEANLRARGLTEDADQADVDAANLAREIAALERQKDSPAKLPKGPQATEGFRAHGTSGGGLVLPSRPDNALPQLARDRNALLREIRDRLPARGGNVYHQPPESRFED